MHYVCQVLEKFIPQLTHENDGLIFSPAVEVALKYNILVILISVHHDNVAIQGWPV